MPNELAHIYVPFGDVIKTTVTTADGSVVPARIVRGTMTDESLDLDKEIVDYDWAKAASTKWWEFANIREQHSTKAVGKGKELEYDDAARSITLTSKIIDPSAIVGIDEGLYSGYSIGVKNARYIKDAKAPNGRLNGGNQVECSIVDHPSLPTAKFAVVKMRKDGKGELAKGVEPITEDDEELLTKVVKPKETKLAATIVDKAAPASDNDADDTDHGHLHTHDQGTDQGYEHSHLHDHPEGLHADGKKGDHQHDHVGKAAKADVAKDATAGACPNGSCDCGSCGPDCSGSCCADCTMGKAATVDATKAAEMELALGALGVAVVKDANGDIDLSKTLLSLAETHFKAKTKEAPKVEPKPEDTKPATEPNATDTTDKTAQPDTMKAILSEVTKAVQSAVKPLQEKIEEMEKRALPGGPMLNGSKLLSAPEEVRNAAIKARLGDLDIETFKDVAENHPDAAMRKGAKDILEKLALA